jgi:ABC-type transporter Mla MlaB component
MHVALHQNALTLIRCYGELSLEELARVAAAAARARADGRMAVVDLGRVTHLHYAGARLLAEVPGLRAAGASRYVRDLLRAGAGSVELYRDVGEAFGAA